MRESTYFSQEIQVHEHPYVELAKVGEGGDDSPVFVFGQDEIQGKEQVVFADKFQRAQS
jgi:hypothetical protein